MSHHKSIRQDISSGRSISREASSDLHLRWIKMPFILRTSRLISYVYGHVTLGILHPAGGALINRCLLYSVLYSVPYSVPYSARHTADPPVDLFRPRIPRLHGPNSSISSDRRIYLIDAKQEKLSSAPQLCRIVPRWSNMPEAILSGHA